MINTVKEMLLENSVDDLTKELAKTRKALRLALDAIEEFSNYTRMKEAKEEILKVLINE